MRFGLLSGVGSLVLFTLAGVCATAQEKHPYHHFHHALWELRDARKELAESKSDWGGHKEKGLVAINAGQLLALCEHQPKFGIPFLLRTARALAHRLHAARRAEVLRGMRRSGLPCSTRSSGLANRGPTRPGPPIPTSRSGPS